MDWLPGTLICHEKPGPVDETRPPRRLASRRGKKRALVAVGRTLLQSVCYLISRGVKYPDLGADDFERRNPESLARHTALAQRRFLVKLLTA